MSQTQNIPLSSLQIISDEQHTYPNWLRPFQIVMIQDTRSGGKTYSRWVDLYNSNILDDIAPILAQTDAKLLLLARAKGRDVSSLQLVDEFAQTLLNDRHLVSYKAIDRVSGDTVGATFENGQVVDGVAIRADASSQWKTTHGALTPDLVNELTARKPEDKVSISIWLAVKVEPLPRPVGLVPATPTSRWPGRIAIDSVEPTPFTTVVTNGVKPLATGIPLDQMPIEVQTRIAQAPLGPNTPPILPKPTVEIGTVITSPNPATVPSGITLDQVRAFDEQNRATLKAQIEPVRARVLTQLGLRGLVIAYASETAPIINLEATRQQVEDLAFLPDIDAIYYMPQQGGITGANALSSARPAQNADLINNVGYNGNGVAVAMIDADRAFDSNPFLTVSGYNDTSKPMSDHPTAVGGIIKSTDSIQHGLSSEVTLYSAASTTFNGFIIGGVDGAMDWASNNARILNNSYWFPNDGSNPYLYPQDRHLDYIVRYQSEFAIAAAGNFGGPTPGCQRNTPYVTSPGKGYNVMTVGDYTDNDVASWTNNTMAPCSGFGNPSGDSVDLTPHDKPEVVAVGESINSTTRSYPWIGSVGGGTSFAAPMVTALAADLVGANAGLAYEPEVLRSIIMATALHNIEGDQRFSDKDGAGAIDATAAMATVERNDWDTSFVTDPNSFPKTYTVFAYKGERVRFAINWLTNPDNLYQSDPLPADLDLVAYRADGTTSVAMSASSGNNFELVDFEAPASESYVFKVYAFSFTGSPTWFGAAWWRGKDRIAPDTGYLYQSPSALGTHFADSPADWGATNYWRAFAIRPNNADHDTASYSGSWFDDPAARTFLTYSDYGLNQVDLIVVDGNHRFDPLEHYRVYNFSGNGTYSVSWSNLHMNLTSGCSGPYSMTTNEVVKVFDVYFNPFQAKKISIMPTSGTNDLGVALFRSDTAAPSSWTQNRFQAVAIADSFGVGYDLEQLTYSNSISAGGYFGLAIYSKISAPASFTVCIGNLDNHQYLPLIEQQ